MLNLKELEDNLRKALQQETQESINEWIASVKLRELWSEQTSYLIKSYNWEGLQELSFTPQLPYITTSEGINSLSQLQGATYYLQPIDDVPDIGNSNKSFNTMAQIDSEPFFCNIAT